MDKVVKIVSLEDSDDDYEFWQSKSYQERLEAVQILRDRVYDLNPEYKKLGKRIQKVVTIYKLGTNNG